MKPLNERIANVLRTKIFMGDKYNSYDNITKAIIAEMNGDEMKEQIGNDMSKIGMITVILAVAALIISIVGVFVSLLLIQK